MRKRDLLILAGLLLALAGGCFCMGAVPRQQRTKDGERRQERQERHKARYYYLEGVRRQVDGHNADAYEYYKKAYELDTTYDEAASAYGQQRLASRLDTLGTRNEMLRSASLMRPFVDNYPEDFDEAQYYAYVMSRLDSLPEAIRIYERTDSLLPQKTITLVNLADAYMAQGETDKALDALNRYERIEGKNPQLSLKKMSYMITRKDTAAAIAEATSLIDFNPSEPSYYLLKGNLFSIMGKQDSVLYYFEKAEKTAPDYGPAKLALADFYLQEGDSARYDEKTYEALLSEDYGIDEKAALLAQYLQTLINDKQNTERGDYLFSVLEEQYPHEPQVLDIAARYSAAKGDFKDAREKIGYAIDLQPTSSEFWRQKMSYEAADSDYNAALRSYHDARKYVHEDVEQLILFAGSIAQIAKNYDAAIDYYNQAIAAEAPTLPLRTRLSAAMVPSDIPYESLGKISAILCTIGDCYFNKADKDSAFLSYDNALLFDPDNAMALNNYAYFLTVSGGDIEKAEKMSSRSLLGENADNPTYLDTYAWILYKKGNFEEAKKYQASAMEKANETDIISADMYDHYGDILAALGDKAGAVENWTKALELEPEDAQQILKKIEDADE